MRERAQRASPLTQRLLRVVRSGTHATHATFRRALPRSTRAPWTRFGAWTWALLTVDLLDELCSGAPSIAAPAIRAELSIPYAQLSLLLLAVPLLAGLILEPPLLLWAARHARGCGVAAGLLVQGVAWAGAAYASGPWSLLCAVTISGLATGVACGLAQARLVEEHPDEPERILVRWTFMGALGDIGAPALFALVERLHGGFRAGLAVCSGLCLLQALWLYRSAPQRGVSSATRPGLEIEPLQPAPSESEPKPVPLMAAATQAFGRPRLMGWVAATLSCALLDEILLVFGALDLHERRQLDTATTDLVLFALALGSVLGIAVTDRLLARWPARTLLAASCLLCIAAYTLFLQCDGAWAAGVCLFVSGIAIGPQYPIAKAQCYRAVREDPIVVGVVEGLFEPLHVVLPWLLGLCAEHYGLPATLALLLVQPVSLLLALAGTRETAAASAPRNHVDRER
ncbi:MAG: MFS transporter [Polyangiales bacterium]